MPVGFLSAEQRHRYGKFVVPPTAAQLTQYFYLDDRDHQLVRRRRGAHNQIGFAIQLGTVRFLGTFLDLPQAVSLEVQQYVAGQFNLALSCFDAYTQPQTWWDHTVVIAQTYGYRQFSDQPGNWQFVRWLYYRAWWSEEAPSVLFDQATLYLVERKILLPGVSRLERLVAGVRERVQQRVWQRLARLPSLQQRSQLESLLQIAPEQGQTTLELWRRSSTRHSSLALVQALKRLILIRQIGIGQLDFGKLPPSRIQALARSALTLKAQAITQMVEPRRIAVLVAFVYTLEATAQDDVLDVFELLVQEILAKSEREGQQARLRTLKDLDIASLRLSHACKILLDKDCESSQVRETIFQQIDALTLAEAIIKVESLTRLPEDHYYPEVLARWHQVRIFLPLLLQTIQFEANRAGQIVLKAVQFLQTIEGKPKPKMQNAPSSIVTKGWSRWVRSIEGTLDRRAYTFCVLEQLTLSLKRRDLFVSPSLRWSNPRAKLLSGALWESLRASVCRSLNLQPTPASEIAQLQEQLDNTYQRTASNWADNPAVRLELTQGQERIVLSHLDKLDEPPSLLALKRQVAALLPRIDLPEMVLEIQARTGFMDEFTHLHQGQARIADFPITVCAALIASACNIGLTPLITKDIAALTRDRLQWVQQNYLRLDTLIAANARLVAAQTEIELAQAWGGGEVASADGIRFVVPVRTINARPNRKYFGAGRGITYYNFTSDQFTGLHGLVVPGTLRDSLVLLVGLLEQKTSLHPREIMTDTAGYSDVIFGLFWLLGYQFSPRLADLGKARFWRLNGEADYGILNKIAKHRINRKLIEENWDDLLRVAGSLKIGTVSAIEIMRALQRGNQPSTLARAIGELGRIAKTLYLLNYVDDEDYRRRILTQLNRGESRHRLARAVFHGRKGEIRQPYREGQEDQLSTLGLVVNVIVLWNTLYMNQAVKSMQAGSLSVKDEDVARLSPLGNAHINMLGHYFFELPQEIQRGEMRPLRNLAEVNLLDEFED